MQSKTVSQNSVVDILSQHQSVASSGPSHLMRRALSTATALQFVEGFEPWPDSHGLKMCVTQIIRWRPPLRPPRRHLRVNIWPDRAAVVADALGQNLLQDNLCAMSLDQSLHVELSCAPAFVAVHPQRQLMLHQMTQRASHSAACCFHKYRYYRNVVSTAIST